MAIAFVKNFHGNDGTGLTTPAGGIAVGNLLVLAVVGHDANTNTLSSVSDADGVNTYTVVSFANPQNPTAPGSALSMAWTIVTDAIEASDAISPVVAIPGNGWTAVAAEFSGLGSSPFDQRNNSQGGFNTTHVSASVTTTQADELLIGSHLAATGFTWVDDGTGLWTIIEQYDPFNAFDQVLQYRIVSSTGTYSSSVNTSGSVVTQDQIVTFKAQGSVAEPDNYVLHPPIVIGG